MVVIGGGSSIFSISVYACGSYRGRVDFATY
jgi:hypothetical protein